MVFTSMKEWVILNGLSNWQSQSCGTISEAMPVGSLEICTHSGKVCVRYQAVYRLLSLGHLKKLESTEGPERGENNHFKGYWTGTKRCWSDKGLRFESRSRQKLSVKCYLCNIRTIKRQISWVNIYLHKGVWITSVANVPRSINIGGSGQKKKKFPNQLSKKYLKKDKHVRVKTKKETR